MRHAPPKRRAPGLLLAAAAAAVSLVGAAAAVAAPAPASRTAAGSTVGATETVCVPAPGQPPAGPPCPPGTDPTGPATPAPTASDPTLPSPTLPSPSPSPSPTLPSPSLPPSTLPPSTVPPTLPPGTLPPPPTATQTVTTTVPPTLPPPPTPTPTPSGTITSPPAGQPCQPPPVPSLLDPSDVADQLERVGHRILDLVDTGAFPGFTGLSADIDGGRLLLCWVRSEPVLPAPIQTIVTSPGEPITVVRQFGDYTRADLNSRAGALLGNAGLPGQLGGDLHTVTVPEEGTGLIAGIEPAAGGPNPNAAAVLTAAAGVPVTVQLTAAPQPTARMLDAAPWWAGARLTDGAGQCTSGFGIVAPGNVQYLLTAYHCFAPAAGVFTGPPPAAAARRIGPVGPVLPGRDAEVIDVAPGFAGGRTYTGGVADATEGSLPVNGAGANIAGLVVCNSGSFSGELCGIVIRRANVNYRLVIRGAAVNVVGGVYGQTGGLRFVANAPGNSGGPIIRRTRPGQVQAMGIDSASTRALLVPCRVYFATSCAPDIFYGDITAILRAYRAVLA